ncbi:MAG: M28 family peptidase [Rikenella sp.]|nr:M28 family peptidase [Rikenella sp.]
MNIFFRQIGRRLAAVWILGTAVWTASAAPVRGEGLSGAERRDFRRGLEAVSRRQAEISLRFLASDELGGRLAGSLEGRIAGRYIVAELERMGYAAGQIVEQPFTGRSGEALRNILVTIPGRDTTRRVIVGAHYDHEGTKNGEIFHGADDNASGVSVLLELARAARAARAVERRPACTLIFAFWDGEERGLLGSRHYVSTLGADTAAVAGYINFDMVGRNTDETRPGLFRYFYTASRPELKRWYDESVSAVGLRLLEADYRPCARTIGGSDNMSFARVGIPIVWYHTDGHPDYNRPTDTADRINYPKLIEIARSAWYLVWRLAYTE